MKSLEDSDNQPEPEVLAAEIVVSLETALELFRSIYEGLGENTDRRYLDEWVRAINGHGGIGRYPRTRRVLLE
jgi:hypothetical protein